MAVDHCQMAVAESSRDKYAYENKIAERFGGLQELEDLVVPTPSVYQWKRPPTEVALLRPFGMQARPFFPVASEQSVNCHKRQPVCDEVSKSTITINLLLKLKAFLTHGHSRRVTRGMLTNVEWVRINLGYRSPHFGGSETRPRSLTLSPSKMRKEPSRQSLRSLNGRCGCALLYLFLKISGFAGQLLPR